MFTQKLVFMFFILFVVSACGKKGDPYVSEPSSFPRSYPRDLYEKEDNLLNTEEPIRESI